MKRRLRDLLLGGTSRRVGPFLGICFLAACFAVRISGSVYATQGAVAGQSLGARVSDTWVRVTTGGQVSINVIPTAGDGYMGVGQGSVNVKTNSPTGYTLYASGLYYDEDGHWAGLYLDGDTSNQSNQIAAVQSSTPSTLSLNQWGFAVEGTGGTDDFSTKSAYDRAVQLGGTTTTTEMNKVRFIGLKGDYQVISRSSNDGSDTELDETTDVYYGVRIGNIVQGSYRNVIVYTAFIDGGDAVTLTPNPVALTEADADTPITVVTGHQSSMNPVTASQVEVQFYDSSDASKNIAECVSGSIAVINGYDGTYGRPLKFTCTLRRLSDAVGSKSNNYDMIVRIDTEGNGLYVSYESENSWRFISTWNYSLTFNGNGAGSGVPADQTGTKNEGEVYTGNTGAAPVRDAYNFGSWSDGINVYNANASVTLTEDNPSKNLTAQWNRILITYSLTYAAGGRNGVALPSPNPQVKTKYLDQGDSETFTIWSTTPTTTDDYTFSSWSDGSATYAPSATYTISGASKDNTDISKTLTAQWTENDPLASATSLSQVTNVACKSAPSYNSSNKTYTIGGKKVRKLHSSDGDHCWTVDDISTATWANAPAVCTNLGGNWKLPAQTDYKNLVDGGLTVAAWNSSSSGSYFWWSSTALNSYSAYDLNLNYGTFDPSDYGSKTSPLSVRCMVPGT